MTEPVQVTVLRPSFAVVANPVSGTLEVVVRGVRSAAPAEPPSKPQSPRLVLVN